MMKSTQFKITSHNQQKNLSYPFDDVFSFCFQSQGNIFFQLLCFAITHFHGMQSLAVARNMSVQEMERQRLTLAKIAQHATHTQTHMYVNTHTYMLRNVLLEGGLSAHIQYS